MTQLRAIDPSAMRARYAGPSSQAAGDRPELQWIKIARLRIDPRYQREIGDRGARNIVAIATKFRWSKFEPVMIAPIEGNLFAVINGQHRATAAALRGFEAIPCCIVSANLADQADAFVAINGDVTAMTPLQLHAARLAAGDKTATTLAEACREADVTICRYPVPANHIKPGETLAVSKLQGLLALHGRAVLTSALSCITHTRRGNPGMIRAPIVEALCTALTSTPEWSSDRTALLAAMQFFDFAAQFNAARSASIARGTKVAANMVKAIASHLAARMATSAAEAVVLAAPSPPAQPVVAQQPHSSAKAPTTRAGVLSIGRDTVSFRGQLRVAPRAALLVAALAKATPSYVGDAFLIARIWNVRPSNAGELMDALVSDLACLKQIGLELQTQKGLGRRLVEISA